MRILFAVHYAVFFDMTETHFALSIYVKNSNGRCSHSTERTLASPDQDTRYLDVPSIGSG